MADNDSNLYQIDGKILKISKAITKPEYFEHTILTDDVFSFVDFYFKRNHKKLKLNPQYKLHKKIDVRDYDYVNYWNQAKKFYEASKILPLESKALTSYYAILNAAKAYIVYKSSFLNGSVSSFNQHGLREYSKNDFKSLKDIGINRRAEGVFVLFSKLIDPEFEIKWPLKTSFDIQSLLYNLPIVHRSYLMTYKQENKGEHELFIPLSPHEQPRFHLSADSKVFLSFKLNSSFFGQDKGEFVSTIESELSKDFELCESSEFTIKSRKKLRLQNPMSSQNRKALRELRDLFYYISSTERLWYLKKYDSQGAINLNPMILTYAIMHRLSEIERYKPEQLYKIIKSKENWLFSEFLSLALDQFIDEIACELTGYDLMPTRHRT